MRRVGFVLRVREDRLEEYRAAHHEVWPEMLDALSRHGWHNYSLFIRGDGTLFGYFETPVSLEQALAGMASEEVNTRWQQSMAEYFDDVPADTAMEELAEVFHLD